jgi:hypothetical protein
MRLEDWSGRASTRRQRAWWRRTIPVRRAKVADPALAARVRLGQPWTTARISLARPSPWRARPALLAALALLALAASALALALALPGWQVRRVRVEGTTDEALVAAVRALPLAGCLAPLCDTTRAATLAKRLPQVAQARAWVGERDMLVVQVTPKAPVLLWRLAGSALLVAGDGTVLGSAGGADIAHLPAVADAHAAALAPGKASAGIGARIAPALVELATRLSIDLPAITGAGTTLRFDAATGLSATDGQGLTIVFGNPATPPGAPPAGVQGQLERLRALLEALAPRGRHATWIDLRWGAQVVYRLG